MTTTKPKGLHAKLAEVMAEAGRIPKNGTAPPAIGGFKFVQVGDAADAIRKALGDRGVSMLPTAIDVLGESEHETSSGKVSTTVTYRTTWTLTDSETGEAAVIQSIGSGADTGDKAAPKAQSSAMKYALLMGFLLSTGDDPETSDSSDRQGAPGSEVLELLGTIQKTGTLQAGSAAAYKGEWREQPNGHAIGLRLKLDGEDRDIPQVLICASIGEALFVSGTDLIGERVTVRGKLYGVRQRGRQTYYRLIVGEHPDNDFVSGPDFRVPPLPEAAEPQPPADTVSVPMFDADEDAAIAQALGVTQ